LQKKHRINGLTDKHKAQFAAFCRNYGSWGSGKIKYTEWNLELIRAMVDDMSPWWDDLKDGFDKTIKYINETIDIEVGNLGAEASSKKPIL
jgi:hypothetical protein